MGPTNLMPRGLENYNNHVHSDEIMSEYTSTGPNILGEIVSAKMAKVVCRGCESESIKFISSLPLDNRV